MSGEVHPALVRWISEVLGSKGWQHLDGEVLFALTLAGRRSEVGPGPAADDEVLEAWVDELRHTERAVLQAKVAYVNAARTSGWGDDRIAATLGLETDELVAAVEEMTEFLRTTHPSAHR